MFQIFFKNSVIIQYPLSPLLWGSIILELLVSSSVQISHSVMSDSATPWIAARQASLPITNSRSLLRLLSIRSVMPSNHLILFHPLLLLPSIFSSIRVFTNESILRIRWLKYWSLSFNISPLFQIPIFQRMFRTDFLWD